MMRRGGAAFAASALLCLAQARAEDWTVLAAEDAAAKYGATGGDEIRFFDYGDGTADLVHIFTNTAASATFAVPAKSKVVPGTMRALVVGGGGSGGSTMGGGGGGGGVVEVEALEIAAGSSATVKVGAGGKSKVPSGSGTSANSQPNGVQGGSSSIAVAGGASHIAYGGGGGGAWGAAAPTAANIGGGGGGCGRNSAYSNGAAGSQGGKGGNGRNVNSGSGYGGGGGGASGDGATPASSSKSAGAGADGKASSITGETLYYGAGGGGGVRDTNATGGAGGKTGDGTGDWGKGADSQAAYGTENSAKPGRDGFGGGGGGGTYTTNSADGNKQGQAADGGSGVVVIRYTVATTAGVSFDSENSIVEGENVYKFLSTESDSTFLVSRAVRAHVLAVGGGGAGASPGAASNSQGGAGGGGAGGFVENEAIILAPGSYAVHVGGGGASAGTAQGFGNPGQASYVRLDGADVIKALGGGGGAILGNGQGGYVSGADVYGSGGGASKPASGSGTGGAAGQPLSEWGGYGFKGGDAAYNRAGGGGGGAGGAGGNSTSAYSGGAGGAARSSAITGTETWYAAGGGGGSRIATGGSGGSGGGVALGGAGGGGSNSAPVQAGDGLDGTGSGGGGGRMNGAGGAGGSGVVIIRVKYVMPEKPPETVSFVYDGTEHLIYEGDSVATTLKLAGATVQDITAKDVGTYVFTASCNDGYCWADGTTDDVTCTVTVTKPQLKDISIFEPGWQIGEAPVKPVISSEPQLSEGEYVFKYSATGEDGTWTETVPDAAGTWYVTAEIGESANFDPPAAGAIPVVQFRLWDWDGDAVAGIDYLDYLGYHAKMTVSGYTGAARENFPVRVEISEGSPDGFLYKHVNPDFSDLRFIGADGEPLSYTVETWNTEGTSIVWVTLPEYAEGARFTMCYGELADVAIPEGAPEGAAGTGAYEGGGLDIDPVLMTPGSRFKNRWLVEPSVSKTSWDAGAEPAEGSAGEPVYGESVYIVLSTAGVALTNAMPSAVGAYDFCAVAEAGADEGGTRSWTALESDAIELTINAETPYESLAGDAADNTLSGRVLLVNDFASSAETSVAGQSWWLTNVAESATGTYWVHEEDGASEVPLRANLKPAVSSDLRCTTGSDALFGSTNLWHLENARIGNLYLFGAAHYDEGLNYLPWSPYAKQSLTQGTGSGEQTDSAHVILRNSGDSAVYSPCYRDGIGTIYFDAVNSEIGAASGDFASIVVEIATNCCEYAEPHAYIGAIPTDENVLFHADAIETTVTLDDGTVVTTVSDAVNSRYGKADWRPVKMKPFIVTAGEVEELPETEELSLAVAEGGSAEKFYRVAVKLDIRIPARFRIIRKSVNPEQLEDTNFILVDNIVASFPAMRADLEPYGIYDETKGGKQILGQEAATSVPFPSVHDDAIFARARPSFFANPGLPGADISAFVTSSRMHYRWRYLEQSFGEWRSVGLDHANGFAATAPLVLPQGLPGDVEFWFETRLDAPFYEYCDYSGADAGFGGLFTENISVVTNRASGTMFQSRGEDWFIRLRDGKSDYETVNLLVRKIYSDGTEAPLETVEMEVVGNHVWRGYLQTLPPAGEDELPFTGILYRFEALNRQTPLADEWEENVVRWKSGVDFEKLPVSALMGECDEDGWASAPYDSATGYYMFQIDDETKSVTVVHGDYQNFNAWNDANKSVFSGSSTEDASKSGASPRSRDSSEDFATWRDMPASYTNWVESFTTASTDGFYVPFGSGESPNGWGLGQGMMVYGVYKDVNTGRAFQMQGQGLGYLEFVNADVSPRGLESIAFTGRLAQFVNFSDFAYYDAGSKNSMSNYTFFTAGAFDASSNTAFSGDASMSLVAYHRPGVGCYEFRVEQGIANVDGAGVANWHKRGQVLSLYKWTYGGSGRLSGDLIGSLTNNAAFNNNDWPAWNGGTTTTGMQPLFISLTNSVEGTRIVAGFMASASGVAPNYALNAIDGKNYNMLCWCDSSSTRLSSGTYGLSSANCKAVFAKPYMFTNPITPPSAVPTGAFTQGSKYTNKPVSFGTTEYVACEPQIRSDEWVLPPGRLVKYEPTTSIAGLEAVVPVQGVAIQTTGAGKTVGWKTVKEIDFSTFGATGSAGAGASSFKYSFYTTDDCSVRIRAKGDMDDPRTDVVLDDLEIRQWRGDDWETVNQFTNCVPSWVSESSNVHTNFIFTSAWITNNSVLLSAKRTAPGKACSIRSPLFDGAYGRGTGLGMFAFRYHGAQPNAKLLFQIATNGVDYTMVQNFNILDDAYWTTVTNFDFSAMSAVERAGGALSCYVGLHGVKGMMRILVDPGLVESVASSSDPARFGDIYIDEVYCRDEPELDVSAWWGWNLRTVGADASGADPENRMFMPDLTTVLGKTGMSLALNNSVSDDVYDFDGQTYIQHVPFVQTPVFGTNIVGEVNFRARMYGDAGQPALVTLYGNRSSTGDGEWEWLSNFTVSNSSYAAYSHKTDQGQNFRAFRLAVVGVDGASTQDLRGGEGHTGLPAKDASGAVVYPYDTPVRVMLDEIVVSEAVRAQMSFRNVGAFRNTATDQALVRTTMVEDVTDVKWQPLCEESWGVQCEIYPSQLPDEIDLERTPQVKFWWFRGEEPWGFENWRTNSAAKSAFLAPATGTNLIYRSSYPMAEAAIVPPELAGGTVYQYGLEAVWWPVGSNTPVTNRLEAAGSGWENPAWYDPVDKNLGKSYFSAYTILDTVAPHWAWINEVNIFGEYDRSYRNSDRDRQYVEIAVPAEANIAGWKVRLLESSGGNGLVVTNTLGTFGSINLPGRKNGNIGQASNMVFRVLACPGARTSGALKTSDGTLDAVWTAEIPTYSFTSAGEINAIDSVGLQLVRPSGVIEHEIVVRGYDWWSQWENAGDTATDGPEAVAERLNTALGTKNFFWAGDDSGGVPNSLSVLESRGETSNQWFNTVVRTPGRINEGQIIDPDHPTPNGESIIVYANLDNDFGHIVQTVGDAVATNANQVLYVKKGSDRGTNIVYTVDPWYELGSVATNGVAIAASALAEPRTYTVTVGVGVSNNVTVVAGAKVKESVEAAGIDEEYRDAVMKWLSTHKDAYGNDWANPDSDDFRAAVFIPYSGVLNGDYTPFKELSLTEMYWLDMDPTVGDLALVAGVAKMESAPNFLSPPQNTPGTHPRLTMYMCMTNMTDDTTSAYYGWWKTPYVIRGMEPDMTSWKFAASPTWRWTNATFKITGILLNGKTGIDNPENWKPLRWFVFMEDSFDQTTKTSRIDLEDPLGLESVARSYGWHDWVEEHGTCPVFFRWAIDKSMNRMNVDPMKTTNNLWNAEDGE